MSGILVATKLITGKKSTVFLKNITIKDGKKKK